MKIQKIEKSVEKATVTGMIVSTPVLARIADIWDRKEGSLSNDWSNRVGRWCVDYYKKYNKAPGKAIKSIFASWADTAQDNDTVDSIQRFLSGLSGEYATARKALRPEYLVDKAAELFNEVKLRKIISEMEGDLDSGKVSDAYARLDKMEKVTMGENRWVDLFRDETEIRSTFTDKQESMIKYNGGCGQFWGRELCKDGFIAYLAPGKRGKTFHLLDMAYRALQQRLRVAFLEIGDLSKRQIKQRFIARAAGRPFYRTSQFKPFRYPKKLSVKDGMAKVRHQIRTYKEDLQDDEAWKIVKDLMRDEVRSLKHSYFQLLTVPNNTLSFASMKSAIKELERKGFEPDVIIIDYVDLFAKPQGYNSSDSREAVNENWKCCRGLSQELHNLVVTATQGNAKSYKADSLDTDHFSEDNRKFTHVTGMCGISQNAVEKEQGVQRLNWLVLREDDFSINRFCFVANALGIANPCLRSVMPRNFT